jgi:hypothetical protein
MRKFTTSPLIIVMFACFCGAVSAAEIFIYPFGAPVPGQPLPIPVLFPSNRGIVWELYTNGLGFQRTIVPQPPSGPAMGTDAVIRGTFHMQPDPLQTWVFSFINNDVDKAAWHDFHVSIVGEGIGCTRDIDRAQLHTVDYGRSSTSTLSPNGTCPTTFDTVFNSDDVDFGEVLNISVTVTNRGGLAVLSSYHLELFPTFCGPGGRPPSQRQSVTSIDVCNVIPEPSTLTLIGAGMLVFFAFGIRSRNRMHVIADPQRELAHRSAPRSI